MPRKGAKIDVSGSFRVNFQHDSSTPLIAPVDCHPFVHSLAAHYQLPHCAATVDRLDHLEIHRDLVRMKRVVAPRADVQLVVRSPAPDCQGFARVDFHLVVHSLESECQDFGRAVIVVTLRYQ